MKDNHRNKNRFNFSQGYFASLQNAKLNQNEDTKMILFHLDHHILHIERFYVRNLLGKKTEYQINTSS